MHKSCELSITPILQHPCQHTQYCELCPSHPPYSPVICKLSVIPMSTHIHSPVSVTPTLQHPCQHTHTVLCLSHPPYNTHVNTHTVLYPSHPPVNTHTVLCLSHPPYNTHQFSFQSKVSPSLLPTAVIANFEQFAVLLEHKRLAPFFQP